jgi:hypothetical protein
VLPVGIELAKACGVEHGVEKEVDKIVVDQWIAS